MIGELKPAASDHILRTLDILIQSAFHSGLFPPVKELLLSSTILSKMMGSCLEGHELVPVLSGYNTIFSRLGQLDGTLLFTQVQLFAQQTGRDANQILNAFVDQLCDRVRPFLLATICISHAQFGKLSV
jgi:hypothetical protein